MKKCFLICPIGKEGSDTRRKSDILLNYIVLPVCKECGYEVIRSDTEFTANSINDDIFTHLDNDELAIADLSGLNPNVFYEAGYRKAKGLPLIHIAQEDTNLPFDITTIRTYFYGIEADKVDSAKEALKKVIINVQNESNNNTISKDSGISLYNRVNIELSNVYKTPVDSGFDYIFKFNFFNVCPSTLFVTNIEVGYKGAFTPFEKDKLPLITSTTHRNNVETERKTFYSLPIPFKILSQDFISGYFELYDKTGNIDINENDIITLQVTFGNEVFTKEYIIPTIESWETIHF